jgi:hypothetical protein
VIERTRLIDFFDSLINAIPKQYLTTIPWLLSNLFKGGLTYRTAQQQTVSVLIN